MMCTAWFVIELVRNTKKIGFPMSDSSLISMLNCTNWLESAIKGKVPPFIRITCLCNIDPLTPHFYIVKLGFTGVHIIFLFLL